MTNDELNRNFIDVLLPKLRKVDKVTHWPPDLMEKYTPDEQWEILMDLYGPDKIMKALKLIPR